MMSLFPITNDAMAAFVWPFTGVLYLPHPLVRYPPWTYSYHWGWGMSCQVGEVWLAHLDTPSLLDALLPQHSATGNCTHTYWNNNYVTYLTLFSPFKSGLTPDFPFQKLKLIVLDLALFSVIDDYWFESVKRNVITHKTPMAAIPP